MLINPQSLDVDVSCEQRGQKRNCNHAKPRLGIQATAKSSPRNDQCPGGARNTQQQDDVSVDSMYQDAFVSNGRHELKDDKKPRRKKAGEMEKHAGTVQAKTVVVALARAGSLRGAEASATKCIVDVDVHEASKREAHQGTAEEQEEEEIVGLGETKRHVDPAEEA